MAENSFFDIMAVEIQPFCFAPEELDEISLFTQGGAYGRTPRGAVQSGYSDHSQDKYAIANTESHAFFYEIRAKSRKYRLAANG